MQEFVAAMERAMQSKGMTPTQLSRRAQVGRPYLYRVLSGEQSPSLAWMEKVSVPLGLSVKMTVSKKR